MDEFVHRQRGAQPAKWVQHSGNAEEVAPGGVAAGERHIASSLSALLEHVDLLRLEAQRTRGAGQNAALEQIFTTIPVARFMASMASERSGHVRLLDAGSGVGTLFAAFVAEVRSWRLRPFSVEVTAYELDPFLAAKSEQVLGLCRSVCEYGGIPFSGAVIRQDFIASAARALCERGTSAAGTLFSYVVLNPPYAKIKRASPHWHLLRTAGIPCSNLYAAFVWRALCCLEPGGELLAILPRGFCSGPSFREFRQFLLESVWLRRIHLFETRDRVFDDVLQEIVIMHVVKGAPPTPRWVGISCSSTAAFEEDTFGREVPYEMIVRPADADRVIRLLPDGSSESVARRMERLNTSLADLEIEVSTGKVIEFRTRGLLRSVQGRGDAPLIWPESLGTSGDIRWPAQKSRKPQAIEQRAESHSLLIPDCCYVLVKRISSKEEVRRIHAALYLPGGHGVIGIENHLNYFHRRGSGIPETLARGLVVYLNSTLVDRYFRLGSGLTQVNAADLRSLPYPTREQLEWLGAQMPDGFPSQASCDSYLEAALRRRGLS